MCNYRNNPKKPRENFLPNAQNKVSSLHSRPFLIHIVLTSLALSFLFSLLPSSTSHNTPIRRIFLHSFFSLCSI